jgi:hypothetical protein
MRLLRRACVGLGGVTLVGVLCMEEDLDAWFEKDVDGCRDVHAAADRIRRVRRIR